MLSLLVLCAAVVELPEAVVRKDAVSVHAARRSAPPLRVLAGGAISSIDPARAVVSLASSPLAAANIRTGQNASIRIRHAATLHGTVVRVYRNCDNGAVSAEIALQEPLPAGVSVGTSVGALIDVGELREVVLVAESIDSSAHSEVSVAVTYATPEDPTGVGAGIP